MNIKLLTATATLAALCIAPAFAAPVSLESGHFVSGAHKTTGTATVYKLDNGQRIIRLSDFRTSNGPAVHIVLTSAKTVAKNGDVTAGKYLDLGSIKGNEGNQNYDLPASVNLSDYHSVSIWCKRFAVNFGAAPLK